MNFFLLSENAIKTKLFIFPIQYANSILSSVFISFSIILNIEIEYVIRYCLTTIYMNEKNN